VDVLDFDDRVERLGGGVVWAPTQRGADNWDTAFQLGPAKCFIVENKATEPLTPTSIEHKITIDLQQLIRYVEVAGAPVYYVLSAPPWDAVTTTAVLDPTAPVPDAARCRTGRRCAHGTDAHGSFAEWAYVTDLLSLIRFMVRYRFPRGNRCLIPAREFAAIPGATTLRKFLDGIDLCHAGGIPYADATAARRGWLEEAVTRRAQVIDLLQGDRYWQLRRDGDGAPGGSGVLAVAVPAAIEAESS
jgi:hypothetical protein